MPYKRLWKDERSDLPFYFLQCGAGVFMAAMHNRQYCGKCHLTYVFDESK
jgi:hypothetical protein